MFFQFFRYFLIFSVGLWPFHADGTNPKEIKATSLELPANPAEYSFIKILVQDHVPEIWMAAEAPYQVLDSGGNIVFKAAKMPATKVAASAQGIQLGVQAIQSNPITILSEGHSIKVKTAWYRNAVQIFKEADGKISVINVISIEDYLKGVLPAEVNPKWSLESLKAQAIASRTYALFKLLEKQNEKHHLSKDVLSQVYGGKNAESYMTNLAVDATRGQILVHDHKIFPAYFHSTCGGHTTRAEFLWGVEPHPSLEGVECNFCWKSPHYRWNATFSGVEIEKRLNAKGVKVSGISNIRLGEKDQTGRAKYFILDTKAGKVNLHSNDFRIWIAPMQLKSTWLQLIEKTKAGYTFKGRGWGHGVGMCQYGIKQLGEMGYTADRILRYYYPNSQTVQYGSAQPLSLGAAAKSLFARMKENFG